MPWRGEGSREGPWESEKSNQCRRVRGSKTQAAEQRPESICEQKLPFMDIFLNLLTEL